MRPAEEKAVNWGLCPNVVLALVAYKIVLLFFAYSSFELSEGFNHIAHEKWPHSSSVSESGFVNRLTTWDARQYLLISEQGYQKESPSSAYYPLLPIAIALLSPLVCGSHFLAGILFTNLCSVVGLCLLHRFISLQHGRKAANLSLVLLLSLPGAFFFSLIYTESLFLLLVVLLLIGIFHEKFLPAAIGSFLLPLARPIGFYCVFPMIAWLCYTKTKTAIKSRNDFSISLAIKAIIAERSWLLCLLALAGYISYFGLVFAFTGDPFDGFKAQQHFPNKPSVGNIFDISGIIDALTDVGSLHGPTNSAIDRVLFLFFLICLPAIWKLNRIYFFYALGCGLLPALSNWFLSYSRFIVLCFPLCIVCAIYLGRTHPAVLWYFIGLAGGIQSLLLVRHMNFRWAG